MSPTDNQPGSGNDPAATTGPSPRAADRAAPGAPPQGSNQAKPEPKAAGDRTAPDPVGDQPAAAGTATGTVGANSPGSPFPSGLAPRPSSGSGSGGWVGGAGSEKGADATTVGRVVPAPGGLGGSPAQTRPVFEPAAGPAQGSGVNLPPRSDTAGRAYRGPGQLGDGPASMETDVGGGAARTAPGSPPESRPGTDPGPGNLHGVPADAVEPAPGTSEASAIVHGIKVPVDTTEPPGPAR